MKICEGKIVELDPTKWYWMVIKKGSCLDRHKNIIRQTPGLILLSDSIDDIEFVENPDRIKGIIVKEF